MADVAKMLEAMHPMREPPAPEPIVPLLVMAAAGLIAAAAIFFIVWQIRHRGGALRNAALNALAASRQLAPAERLAAQASMLRRLARGLTGDDNVRLQGRAWLERLDHIFKTTFFTAGAGTAFGEALYRTQSADVDALDDALTGLLAKVRA